MLTPEDHTMWAKLREAVRSGSLATADRKTLITYSAWLCESGATDTINNAAVYEQSCELVRLHMLRTFMDEVENRSARLQCIVVLLTVAAIIGTGFQTWYGYKADKRAEAELAATAQQHKAKQSSESVPTLAPPQAARQASNPTVAASATSPSSSAPK